MLSPAHFLRSPHGSRWYIVQVLSGRAQALRTLPAPSTAFCSKSGSGDDDDANQASLLTRWFRAKPEKAEKDQPASASVAGASAKSGEEDSAAVTGALVPSGPERRQFKVLVVELQRKPLFPGIYTPVMITKNEKLIKEIVDAKKQGGQAYVGAFLRRSSQDTENTSKTSTSGDAASHLYEYGTFAQVHTILQGESPDAGQMLLLGHRRIRRKSVISEDPLRVHIEHLRDETYTNDDILKATSMEIVNTMRELLHLNPLYGEQFRTLLSLTGSIDLQDTSRLMDAAASLTSADDITLQQLLEQLNVPDRAKSVLMLLKKEVELCRLQADIREQVESKIMKEQRRMLLMEQLKSIKKELGLEKDDKSALIQRFTDRFAPKKEAAPEEAQRVVSDELEKLSGLEPSSAEFNVTRNYLEWLTSLPWGEYTDEVFDIERARKVLDEDHHGLEDVKERILEFIAVSALRGSTHGKILCLVGPPGVGKTSVGRSIANTLNRKYYRFSVGGLHDVAEIKGHRRTYVGAMPGKMVQCLKSTQSSNPLVLIDEIDKLGRGGHAGDPASALLELLDPEQNGSFRDHYLDVPIDLSKALFVCTANVLDTIPGPLLDRMETIRLSGYDDEEKRMIARKYLEPAASKEAGVPASACRMTDHAMEMLINEYCREAGVRNLKKQLEKVYRKVALKLIREGHMKPAPPELSPAKQAAVAAAAAASAPSVDSAPSSPSSTDHSSTAADSCTPSESPSSPPSDSAESTQLGSGSEETAAAALPCPSLSTHPHYEVPGSVEPVTVPLVVIDVANLHDYVGQKPFATDRLFDQTPPGVVMGLAWTAMGGATLYIEAAKVVDTDSKGGMTTTGQLGDVFRESASIAHTFARAYLHDLDPHNAFFSRTFIHVHVPAGATPKDGPSAGCTIITALLSLALNLPVLPDLAMTGEVTLTGQVLPIGGVKEKILAARRSGVKQVLFPEGNRKDFAELAPELTAGLTVHFVSTYPKVFQFALGHHPMPPPTPAPKTSSEGGVEADAKS